MIDLVIRQLLHRFKIQCTKKVRNYPFLMGQGIWIDSEDLDIDDSVAEILKHGTLSIGFIGLAETLKALIGKHHGESEEAQKLGLEIIGHMRKRMDDESVLIKKSTERSRGSQTGNTIQILFMFRYITRSKPIKRLNLRRRITH